jgi:hypothetical protein
VLTKKRAGIVGAVAVLLVLLLQSAERWSLIVALLAGLRGSGPVGTFIAGILVSPLLALVLALASIYLVWEGRKDAEIVPSVASMSSSAARQNVNTGPVSQHFEPHITFVREKKGVQEAKEETPNLAFAQARKICLAEDAKSVWQEVASSEINGMVADFRNIPKLAGQSTVTANSVTAKLVFRSPDLEDLHVNHGTWLKHYTHSASFRPGDTHSLVIAVKLLPFVTLENPRARDPFAHRVRSQVPVFPVNRITLCKSGELEIVLVDSWGVTVFHGLFDYHLASSTDMQLVFKP